MAAHLHWRLSIAATGSVSPYIRIAEIEMRASPGGADQCVGGTPGATGTPALAFDGDPATYWTTTEPHNPWIIEYHFAAPVRVAEVMLQAPTSSPDRAPTTFSLLWSDDNISWTSAVTHSTTTFAAGEIKVFSGDPNAIDPLSIVGVTPDRITIAGGASGTVTVSGGTGTITAVTIGGAAVSSLVDNGDGTAAFVFPAHAAGAVDLAVTRGSETATLVGGVTYYEPDKSEILGYSSLTDTTASPLRRGAYGTPRGSHTAGAGWVDIESALTLKIPSEWIGKPLKIKLCSFNKSGLQTQDRALVTAYDFTPTRVEPPYPDSVTLDVSTAVPVVTAGQYRETAVEGAGAVSVADGTVTAPLYAVVEWTMEEPWP